MVEVPGGDLFRRVRRRPGLEQDTSLVQRGLQRDEAGLRLGRVDAVIPHQHERRRMRLGRHLHAVVDPLVDEPADRVGDARIALLGCTDRCDLLEVARGDRLPPDLTQKRDVVAADHLRLRRIDPLGDLAGERDGLADHVQHLIDLALDVRRGDLVAGRERVLHVVLRAISERPTTRQIARLDGLQRAREPEDELRAKVLAVVTRGRCEVLLVRERFGAVLAVRDLVP